MNFYSKLVLMYGFLCIIARRSEERIEIVNGYRRLVATIHTFGKAKVLLDGVWVEIEKNSSGELVVVEPVVTEINGLTHCDSNCPLLNTADPDRGVCLQDGRELVYHDYFIARCAEENQE